ncbi:MAG: DEAD/DEAH box helicase [Phycisphaerales bacterium]|nr:DEAD/DEAH box helicase [Phycisphaerales bacterium]
MGDQSAKFKSFFSTATGQEIEPFPFQCRFALEQELPALVSIPTGLGKTPMAVVGWLWRRHGGGNKLKAATPRRLVYCLPMRVLVEQTRECAERWVAALRAARLVCEDVPVHVLMGGEEKDSWDIHPERDAIIIGTQDMLLSRALNRGYAARRARWPMHFGLLNTDCLWVFDEVQLMGSGLATTAQLEAFRRQLTPTNENGGNGPKDNGCKSVWMSATLRPDWLRTVDFKGRIDDQGCIDGKMTLSLSDEEKEDNHEIKRRWNAKKPLSKVKSVIDPKGSKSLAAEVVKAHDKAKGRTIVVVNTVKRACELWAEIKKQWSSTTDDNLVLIHSRLRPADRTAQIKKLQPEVSPDKLPPDGMIVVSTQVIEAGVDVSATTLFTELAPWASLVQRFGRCNRKGEENANAAVRWIDLPAEEADAQKVALPYELGDLRAAAEQLKNLNDVGLGSLDALKIELPFRHTHVIRRKDLIDLFDTTPDLAGNDIDIDRYVREIDETDVRVFWRAWESDVPGNDEPPPDRGELCPAPIGDFKKFVKDKVKDKVKGKVFSRDFLEGKWVALDAARIAPGQVYMVHVDAGGYVPQCGWDPSSTARVEPLAAEVKATDPDDFDDDGLSRTDRWQTIAEHTSDVCSELESTLNSGGLTEHESACLRAAARWHDWGKVHDVFQSAVKTDGRPDAYADSRRIAKAPGKRKDQAGVVVDPGFWTRYARKHFRHELASALAVLQKSVPIGEADRDLVAYLIAAHHGKVRLSIRSFPDEKRPRAENGTPQPQKRFARGVWDGDDLPTTDLGGGVHAPAVTLALEPMELGLCESPPFVGADGVGEPSWIERVLRLREEIGPFRLAYLEAVLRAADERASAAASGKGAADA